MRYRASVIALVSLLVVGCSLRGITAADLSLDIYPSADIKVNFQQDWQVNLYHNRIAVFEETPVGLDKIVFLGDSLTQGASSWNDRFGLQNLVNRGIAGDITEGVLARLDEIAHYEPLAVFVLIGINDIFDSHIEGRDKITPQYVANNILRIASCIQSKSKATKVFIQTILPVDLVRYTEVKGVFPVHVVDLNDQICQINSILTTSLMAQSTATLIDLHKHFVDDRGMLDVSLSSDGVHLSEAGYSVWVENIRSDVNESNQLNH